MSLYRACLQLYAALVKRMPKKSAVLLVLPLCLGVLLPGCSRAQAPGGSATATAAATGAASATPDQTGTPLEGAASPTAEAGGESPAEPGAAGDGGGDPETERQLAAAPVGEASVLESGTTITLGALSNVSLGSEVPGEVAGDGLLVPVTISNPGTDAVSLEALVVTCSYGAGNTPAPVHPSASDPVPGSVGAGESVTFSVAFRVPKESRDHVRVVVDLDASQKAAVFEGSAPSA